MLLQRFLRLLEERGERRKTPDSADAEKKRRAQSQELRECLHEAWAKLKDRDKHPIRDDRPLAAAAIKKDTEEDLCGN